MRLFITSLFVVGMLLSGCASTTPTIQTHTPQKILFIGNSITVVGPVPSIGWLGNWGMAASSEDKDFKHQVAAKYEAEIKAINVADWERGYTTYDYNVLAPYVGWADTVIIKVGENVVGYNNNFSKSFKNLVSYVAPPTKDIYIVSTWWVDNYSAINSDMKKVATDMGVQWVQIPDHDASYNALTFSDAGVAGHPGDKGMKLIADSIITAMSNKYHIQNR